MKHPFLWGLSATALLLQASCSSGKLYVPRVDYQAIRTDFAQPQSIPASAKIAVEYFINNKGVIQPVVYNRTAEILTIDQTKSFIIMPDGASISYYDPTERISTTSTYDSSTTGASFNLGGIAEALGIGGAAGSLLNATTVGGSGTTGLMRQNTVRIVDQPQVHIGPKGSIAMSKAFTLPGIGSSMDATQQFIDASVSASPVKFSICISYSTDDGATYDRLVTQFYVSSQISQKVENRKVSSAFYSIYAQKSDALAENLYMFFIPNNIKESSTNTFGDFLSHTNNYDYYLRGSLVDYQ